MPDENTKKKLNPYKEARKATEEAEHNKKFKEAVAKLDEELKKAEVPVVAGSDVQSDFKDEPDEVPLYKVELDEDPVPLVHTRLPRGDLETLEVAELREYHPAPEKLGFYRLRPSAKLPTRATEQSACWDLYAAEDVLLVGDQVRLILTGWRVIIPEGYRLDVRPRSGLWLKEGVLVGNAPGTIDSDYTGELCVAATTVGRTLGSEQYLVQKGDRVAQISLEKVIEIEPEEVKELPDGKDRGGFGSTGK